jgi:hypothetical protein
MRVGPHIDAEVLMPQVKRGNKYEIVKLNAVFFLKKFSIYTFFLPDAPNTFLHHSDVGQKSV